MTGPTLRPVNAVSQLAIGSGLGAKPLGGTVATCPHQNKGGAGSSKGATSSCKPLEYCDIQTLKLTITAQDKSATIVIDRNRRVEGVAADVAQEYRGLLGSRDIVIEGLSDVRDQTETASRTFLTSECKPLDLTAVATNSVSHTSFTPAHPHVQLQGHNFLLTESDGGAPTKAQYFAPGGSYMSGSIFAWLCPHSRERVREYSVRANSCGNLPIPQKPLTELSAEIVVFPYEENTIEIGAKGRGRGYSKTDDFVRSKDGQSGRTVTRTTTVMKQDGDTVSSSTTEKMRAEKGAGRTRTTQTTSALTTNILSSDSKSVTTVKQSWQGNKPKTKAEDDWEASKVTFKRKLGGIETSFDAGATVKKVNETIEAILAVKKVADKLQKIFKSVKIGWSFSASYEILAGNLALTWGNRWPSAWKEESRVYYIERYCAVTGTVEPIKGSVTGFFGFAVDPWYAPVSIEVGAYVELKLETKISGNNTLVWTRTVKDWGIKPYKLDASGKISLEAGAKANGRAFGYSVTSRFALEGEANLTIESVIGGGESFYLRSSLVIGKESDTAKGKRLDALRLVGEVVYTGWSVRRQAIEPIGLVDGGKAWDEYYIWGQKPREG